MKNTLATKSELLDERKGPVHSRAIMSYGTICRSCVVGTKTLKSLEDSCLHEPGVLKAASMRNKGFLGGRSSHHGLDVRDRAGVRLRVSDAVGD